MISRLRLSTRFIVLALIVLCTTAAFATPPRKRTVSKLVRPNEPIELIAIRVKGKPIIFEKAFAGQNNWLGGLTLVIKNTSTKPVDWVKVALKFPKEKGSGYGLVDFVTYGIGRSDIEKFRGGGPPLKPGETAEVSYSWDQYQSLREILDGMNYPKSITLIEASIDQVSFVGEHEVLWIQGELCKEDYHSPTGWSPVKP
jgi:hypothetical protein